MANTIFPIKSLVSRGSTNPSSPSLSSLESKLYGIRLTNPIVKIDSRRFSSASLISARFGGYRPPPRPSPNRSKDQRKNVVEEDPSLDISSIRSATVRLIDVEQNMVGVVPKSQAIQMAEDADLDLVIVSPDADPPVLRMMDYNKFRYEQQKRKREQQKKSIATRMDLKELKMGYNIDTHDYTVRLKAAQRFLKEGNKVKIGVNLKGREKDFRNTAIELVKRFQNDVGELAVEESKSFRDHSIFLVLVPNKAIIQKAQEQPKKKKKEKPAVTEVSAATSVSEGTEVSAETEGSDVTEVSTVTNVSEVSEVSASV